MPESLKTPVFRSLSTTIVALGLLSLWTSPVSAQSITLPENGDTQTRVEQEGNRYDISGETRSGDGINLFHTLATFGLDDNEIANFIADPNIQNILTRITGGEVSLINGQIQISSSDASPSMANLFLMNPAGIIFGTDASVNVPSDFIVTNAIGIGFEDGWFSAIGNNDYDSLGEAPNRLFFDLTNPSGIINAGAISANQDVIVLGNTVINTGTIDAGRTINIASILDENIIRISQPGNVLSLEFQAADNADAPNLFSISIESLADLLTGGDISEATNLRVTDENQLFLVESEAVSTLPVAPGNTIISNSDNLSISGTDGAINILVPDTNLDLDLEALDISETDIDYFEYLDTSDGEAEDSDLGDNQSPVLLSEEDTLFTEGDPLFSDEDPLFSEEDPLAPEEDSLFAEEDPLVSDEDALFFDEDTLSPDEDALFIEEDTLFSDEDVFFSDDVDSFLDDTILNEELFVLPPLLGENFSRRINSGRSPSDGNLNLQGVGQVDVQPLLSTPNDGSFYGLYSVIFPDLDDLGNQNLRSVWSRQNIAQKTASLEAVELTNSITINRLSDAYRRYQRGVEALESSNLEDAYQLLTQSLDELLEIDNEQLRAYILTDLSAIAHQLGNNTSAIQYAQESLDLSQRLNNSFLEVTALLHLCEWFIASGNEQRAIESCQAGIALGSSTESPSIQDFLFNELTDISHRAEDSNGWIERYHQYFESAKQIGDPYVEAFVVGRLASFYYQRQDYDKADRLFQRAVSLAEQMEHPLLAAFYLSQLGHTHYLLGNYDLAEQAFLSSGSIQKILNDKGIVSTFINLGNVYFVSGHYADAIDLYQKALDIAQENELFRLESIALGNLGSVFGSLGNNARAIEFHNQHLELASRIGDSDSMANALGNLGNTYGAQENYQQAIELYQQQLQQARNSHNDILEAIALNNLGQIYRKVLQYQKAIDSYQDAQQIVQRQGNRQGEAVIALGLGQIFHDSGQYFEALNHYQDAFRLHHDLGNLPAERDVAAEIGQLLNEQGQPELAIIFYKHAVNTSEVIRQDIRTLPLIVQQNYTDEVLANTYRALADLLLQQDRILEAQRVLDLLKVQELQDYLGQLRGNENTTTGIDYHQPEQRILDLYDEAVALGLELDQLRQIEGRDRSPTQQTRLNELVAIEQDIINSFFDFIDSPEIIDLVNQLDRTARRQNLDLDQLNALRNDLKQLDQNAVLFYPLILEDRLELILVTPYSAPIRRTVPVRREVFNQAILEFRQELTQSFGNNFTAAQQLYNWMIAPLEEDLRAAGAETLLYAPDGQLRYIPLTALRNGDQWLVETYRVTNITAASLTNFARRPSSDIKVLAAAFKDADSHYNFNIGQRSFAFAGLPFAGLEVEAIANDIPNTTVLLDPDFNRATTVPQMNDHSIVHLATHAGFVPGTPEESFILFGDGDRANLRDVATWPLSNVDLVVLSACQTAVGDVLGNGEEILGFGYQIQRTGARAAIASLWAVDDGGTQILMNLFYHILSTGNVTKAEALQQAQIAMLTGDLSALEIDPSRLAQPIQTYRHPRYWSPFILIGNGL